MSDKITHKEIRDAFHDISNELGLVIFRGGYYARSAPRDFSALSKEELIELYNKALDEHGNSEANCLKANKIMLDIKMKIYDGLGIDPAKPVE